MWIPGTKTLDSSHLSWHGITLKGYRYTEQEVTLPPMRDYMLVTYRGAPSTLHRRAGARWQKGIVRPGIVTLLTRGEESNWRWDRSIDVRHIYISHDVIDRIALQIFDRKPVNLDIDDCISREDEVIPYCLNSLEQELSGQGCGENLYLEALRMQIGIHILRRYAKVSVSQPPAGALGPMLRRRIRDYIEEMLCECVRVEDLAVLANLSPYHFARKFKSEFGVPPHTYVLHRRVERAKSLLLATHLPLKVIALDCGFADQVTYRASSMDA